ncbi:delta-60 repeat domain-containing protein [Dyadobacter chenwenxiniae]|uniref:delta-60 repeat domain-containing protein n=1 Tax=Dyadobacter chenwenxiniae TaxID=2906456 RepID=UPI0035B5FBC1
MDEDVALSGTLQPDGKIIAAGYSWNGTTYDFAMVRYTVDGFRDMPLKLEVMKTFTDSNPRTGVNLYRHKTTSPG